MKLNRKQRKDYLKRLKKDYAKHLKKRPFNGNFDQFKVWSTHDLIMRKKMSDLLNPDHDHEFMQGLPTIGETEDAPNPDEQEEQDNE